MFQDSMPQFAGDLKTLMIAYVQLSCLAMRLRGCMWRSWKNEYSYKTRK